MWAEWEEALSRGIGFATSRSEAIACLHELQALLQPESRHWKAIVAGKLTTEVSSALARYVEALPFSVRVPRFWVYIRNHREIPITLTEGAKKSLALLSQGYVAIALVGVNGGILKYDKIGGEKIRKLKSEIIPDLAQFAQPGREFILAFDQDIKPHTRFKVEGALSELAYNLQQTGSGARIAQWEGKNGLCKGVDDLIVAEGPQAWDEAYQSAAPVELWRIARELTRRVKRTPDLNIGNQELTEAVEAVKDKPFIALWAFKGTRKSGAIAQILKNAKSFLSITHLRALAHDQEQTFGGVFINESDRYGSQLLDAQGNPVRGGIVCVPSLLAVSKIDADVLVIDEPTAVIYFMLASELANRNGIRPLIVEEFERRVREAKQVIIADADLNEDVLRYLESLRGEPIFLVCSERKPLAWEGILLEGTRKQAIAQVCQAVLDCPPGKVIFGHFDERATVEAICDLLQSLGTQCLPITQKTVGGEVEQEFLRSKGATIPWLVDQGVRFIATSPSVTQGFSIEKHTDRIHGIYGIYSGCSITAEPIAQSLDRTRALIRRYIWLPERGRAYSKLSTATTVDAVLKDIETSSRASLRLARLSLRTETLKTAEGIDFQRENLKMLASFEAQRNRGMQSLRYTVWALLEQEGKRIRRSPCTVSKEEAMLLSQQMQEAKYRKDIERATRIANGIPLTQEQVQDLEKRLEKNPDSVSQEELEALERFLISQFYRTDEVTEDLVLWDKSGQRRKQIRRLEGLLTPSKAIAQTAHSIERNASTPQDWSKAGIRTWLLERTRGIEFIQQVWTGNITHIDSDSIQTVADQMQRHPEEFRLAFGMKNCHKLKPMQVIAWLLDWCGIARIPHKQRRGGEVVNVYEIDQDNLSRLHSVLERRSQCDPPMLESTNIPGDGSHPREAESPKLQHFLYWWDAATTDEEREAIVLEATALGFSADPEQWRAIA
jgi:hypothetical protein